MVVLKIHRVNSQYMNTILSLKNTSIVHIYNFLYIPSRDISAS